MVFAKHQRIRTWQLNDHKIEQLKMFKYLRVIFSGPGESHIQIIDLECSVISFGIGIFYQTRGDLFIPEALKLFTI